MDVSTVAARLWARCLTEGQAAYQIDGADAADVARLRQTLRERAREEHVRIRTACLSDVVVVARLDAALWEDDATTMRAKLTPP